MAKVRDFNTIEQAINHALKNLSDEDLKDTKKRFLNLGNILIHKKQNIISRI